MQSNWWMTALSTVEMVSLAAALVILIWRRQSARWPSLIAALTLELATDLALLVLMRPGHYKAYFYTFWIASALQALVRVWVIADVIRSFQGIDFLPKQLYLFVGLAGLTMAVASAVFCYHSAGKFPRELQETVMLLNNCVGIAWATFAVAVLSAVKILNLGWSPQGARIATGIFARICVSAIVAQMLTVRSVSMRSVANGFDTTCSIVVFLSWIYITTKYANQPEFDPTPESPEVSQSLALLLNLRLNRER